jgi:hypothetical protein
MRFAAGDAPVAANPLTKVQTCKQVAQKAHEYETNEL